MNNENLISIYNDNDVQNLISYISSQEMNGKKLRYGFRVDLSYEQTRIAKEMNKLYSAILWGVEDSAANIDVCLDEINVLGQVFANDFNTRDVLEVGCGSGRVTQFLLQKAQNVIAIDYEKDVINRCEQKEELKKKNVTFLQVDFCGEIEKINMKKYNTIILAENLIGMNPLIDDRIQILKNVEELLLPDGTAVIGFRVDLNISQPEFSYQAMEWQVSLDSLNRQKIYGIGINWSVGYFLKLLNVSTRKLSLSSIIAGNERPAGGYMYYALLKRNNDIL